MKKASKQDKSVNFVQTVGTNDCFSTEPVISICFFGGGQGGKRGMALYVLRVGVWGGWGGEEGWDFSVNGRGLCNDYL